MKKHFKREKDLRLFVKKFLKTHLKGLPKGVQLEIKVKSLKPPLVSLFFPFYSEGNLIRANEVDFLLKDLENLGIKAELYYIDDTERNNE
ncbi:MAG: hypothetical protein DRP29_00790 [Thermodesulfobacteriota bacterium]|nr:MAG: hypothetical protein DRP29_00790 [Thermodesulfobacteriota bacterium]